MNKDSYIERAIVGPILFVGAFLPWFTIQSFFIISHKDGIIGATLSYTVALVMFAYFLSRGQIKKWQSINRFGRFVLSLIIVSYVATLVYSVSLINRQILVLVCFISVGAMLVSYFLKSMIGIAKVNPKIAPLVAVNTIAMLILSSSLTIFLNQFGEYVNGFVYVVMLIGLVVLIAQGVFIKKHFKLMDEKTKEKTVTDYVQALLVLPVFMIVIPLAILAMLAIAGF